MKKWLNVPVPVPVDLLEVYILHYIPASSTFRPILIFHHPLSLHLPILCIFKTLCL